MTGTLYIVGTPIGNLGDMSSRAVDTLRAATLILAEDTRHSATLTRHFGIATPLHALHAHNEAQALPGLLARLQAGETLALISDAGMPLISDPGFPLVRACHEAGLPVRVVPGPSAVVAQAARVQNLDARGRRRERIVRRETAVLVFRARAVLQGRRVPLLARRGSPGRRGTPGPGRGDGMRRRLALVRWAILFWEGWRRVTSRRFAFISSRLVSPRDARPRGVSSTVRASIILFERTRSTAFSRRARPRRRPRAPPRERSRCGR